MFKIDWSDGLFITGVVLTLVLIVLDKAGKLKGSMLLILLAVAGILTLPLMLNIGWVSQAHGLSKFSRGLLMFFVVGVAYSLIAVWVSPSGETDEPPVPGPTELITVSPREIKLNAVFGEFPQRGAARYDINIQNRTDDPFYTVWVKMIVDSALVSDVRVEWIEPKKALTHLTLLETFCLCGIDLQTGQNIIYIHLRKLKPRELLLFNLINASPEPLPGEGVHRVLISLLSFSRDEAPPIYESRKGTERIATIPFQYPEGNFKPVKWGWFINGKCDPLFPVPSKEEIDKAKGK